MREMALLAILMEMLLSGCAGIQEHLVSPQDVSTSGLLVGTFAGGAGPSGGYTLIIDDNPYNVRYHAGSFVVALPPGEHTLQRANKSSSGSYYAPMGVSATSSSSYPMQKKVTIKAGKITSLGAMYFVSNRMLHQTSDPDRYNILHIDNSRFIETYLRRYHGDVYSALADKTIYPSAYGYLDAKKLALLQQLIAYNGVQPDPNFINPDYANAAFMISSDLGTAGEVVTNANGKPIKYTPLPLDTLQYVTRCDAESLDRYACIVLTRWTDDDFERRLQYYHNGRPTDLNLPADLNPYTVKLFGKEGLAVGGFNYEFYSRPNDDADWQVHTEKGVKSGLLFATYQFADTPEGFFTYYDGNKYLLTFTDINSGNTRTLPLPDGFDGGHNLVMLGDNLFIGPEWNLISASSVYRRQKDGQWRTIKLPLSKCSTMAAGPDPQSLLVSCGGNKQLLSRDRGITWQTLPDKE